MQDTDQNDLNAAIGQIEAAQSALVQAIAVLAECLETAVKSPLNIGSTALKANPTAATSHRRLHRPGRPPIIESDAELKAFILARIDHCTFTEIQNEIAEAFEASRRVRRTAIHKWWRSYERANRREASP